MTNRYLVVLFFSFHVAFFTQVSSLGAKDLDFKNIPCSAFDNNDDLLSFTFWLDGYFSGVAKDHVLDEKMIESILEKTLEACQNNPKKAVFQIVKDLKS